MSDNHWAHDDELIERFILNRLNPEERNELEDHLRICEVCKQEVRAQRLLAAGIRRAGRDEAKERLKNKTADLPANRIPWPHVLSAAAVIVILLSVGIYNRWIEFIRQQSNVVVATHPEPTLSEPASPEPILPKTGLSEGAKPDQVRDFATGSQTLADEHATQPPPRQPVETPAELRRRRELATLSGKEAKRKREESDRMVQGPVASQSSQGAGVAAGKLDTMQDIEIGETNAQEIWVEGTILPSPEEQHVTARTNSYDSETKTAQALPRKNAINQQAFIVTQLPANLLPPSQQRFRHSGKIKTKIEQVGERLQFTMYVDSLMSEADLMRPTIEPMSNDSIVVNLLHSRIRYKLPPQLTEQLAKQVK